MKSWLTKFRISSALDSGKPMSSSLRREIGADPEAQYFLEQTDALGKQLKNLPPSDPSLHDSIMRAVRASAQLEPRQPAPRFAWLAATIAVAVVAAACFWMSRPQLPSPSNSSLNAPIAMLEMSETMPAAMPSVVVAPLSDEWARVNKDVQGTTKILLACFP